MNVSLALASRRGRSNPEPELFSGSDTIFLQYLVRHKIWMERMGEIYARPSFQPIAQATIKVLGGSTHELDSGHARSMLEGCDCFFGRDLKCFVDLECQPG